MTHPDTDDLEAVETTDAEDAQLLLADPDDYHRAQRLRQIHEARREVHKALRETEGMASSSEHTNFNYNVAVAVSAYITELEPLMDAVEYDDTLDRSRFRSLREYATTMGDIVNDDLEREGKASRRESLFVFRQANRFLAEVKPLVSEEETNEWEV